ncbi:MAG TPA: ABC-2 family transporter protein [Ruminiclostridium sp.]
MRKYIETSKLLFKNQLVYRFDIIISMVFTVSKILLAFVLWGTIFGNQKVVVGFTFSAMLSYYVISSFITQLDQSSNAGWQISTEIKNGSFSKYIIKPMSILGYFTAQTFGISAFLVVFNLLAASLWVLVFRIDFTFTSNLSLIAAALLLILLGLLFMIQLNYYIGILAFRFVDTSVFMMIKDNIIQFLTGALIPLTLLPAGIIKVMMVFPFYYISYLPSMLLIGRNGGEIVLGIVLLIGWNGAFWILNHFTFKKLIYKYEGVGM